MSKFKKLDQEYCNGAGLVKNMKHTVSAQALCVIQLNKQRIPVGVLLGSGCENDSLCKVEQSIWAQASAPHLLTTDCIRTTLIMFHSNTYQVPLFWEHLVSEEAMADICDKHANAIRSRPTRAKKVEGGEPDTTMGYKSFKQGDIVVWDGGQVLGGEDVTKIREIVFACMVFDHRGQQRRYLITYDSKLDKFSLNAWTSWKRTTVISAMLIYNDACTLEINDFATHASQMLR